jgi:hypothetical protein
VLRLLLQKADIIPVDLSDMHQKLSQRVLPLCKDKILYFNLRFKANILVAISSKT